MQYVKLGRTGLKVSRICLGCGTFGNSAEWQIEVDQARPIVQRALDLGINFFDTANAYSRGRSEEIVGELVSEVRENVVIATKVYRRMGEGPNDQGLSRIHLYCQLQDSLKRLRTDFVDLYQIHRWDYDTPIQETLTTLSDFVREGRVRYIGASTMYAWQFADALWTSYRLGLERFESMQNQYNLCYREEERELIPLCRDQEVAIIPWGPLAGGFLTGKYRRGQVADTARARSFRSLQERLSSSADFDVAERVEEVAIEKDVTSSQVAIAWLLGKQVTAPIIGATKVSHVEEAVGALDVHLTQDDVGKLEEPYRTHSLFSYA